MRFRPPTLDPKQDNYQREHATSACAARKEEQNWIMLSLVLSTVSKHDTGTVESSFKGYVPHAPATRLDASQRPLRNVNTQSPQLFQIHCCVAARIAVFFSPDLILQGPPRSCVHGAVNCSIASHMDLSDFLLCVVNVRLHGSSVLLSAVCIPSF